MKTAMLLSCSSFEGFFGGVQGQTRETFLRSYRNDWAWYYAAGLQRNNVSPVLYIPSKSESGKYLTDVGIPVRFLPLDRWYQPLENFWMKRLIRQSRYSLYADERLNAIAFMQSLNGALAEDQIDLLYVQEYWSGRFDHLTKHIAQPVVGADHGGLGDRVVKAFKRDAFSRAAHVDCQTDEECRIVKTYGGVARLQPNGCDTTKFYPPQPAAEREKSVLVVARLTDKQKRISDLIRALAILPADWRLDIVGTGPDREKLEQDVDKLQLRTRVKFHGFLKSDEVREHFWRCGVYAMPSSNEAIALAALEAMGCGASVVLSRIRSFETLVSDGKNGRLVPVGDPDALAAAILEAWSRRTEWGSAAAATVRDRFDTAVLYERLANSLRDAVSRPPAQTAIT